MQTIDLSTVQTLVPPTRLSQLLVSRRVEADESLQALEQRAQGRFSMGDLLLLESGSVAVSDGDIEAAATLYGVDLGTVTRGAAQLIIDRNEGRLLVGNTKGKFKPTDDDRQIMLRYLALVFQLRETPPGRVLPPRLSDLDVLSDVFSCTPEHVRDALEELMLHHPAEIQNRHALLRRKFLVPTIGVLVALTAVGGLLLVNGSSGTPSPTTQDKTGIAKSKPTPGIPTAIGTAMTMERTGDNTVLVTESAPASPRTGASTTPAGGTGMANIGDAMTIETKGP